MIGTLVENALFRVGPWRALGAIFAAGLALILAILLGQPNVVVAPPSEVPLVPPRGPVAARAAASGQMTSEQALVPLSASAVASAETTEPGAPPKVASAPSAAPPEDARTSERERQRAAIEGRLGDTRQSIEGLLGPPAAHLSGQEFLYRAPTRLTVTYAQSNRAALFTIWAPRDPKRHPLAPDPRDWTASQAREIAGLFVPVDAQLVQSRKGFLGQPEDFYSSEALASAVGRADYVLAGAKGPPGAFGVLLTLNQAGTVSAVTIGLR